jgi:hypothetical protein
MQTLLAGFADELVKIAASDADLREAMREAKHSVSTKVPKQDWSVRGHGAPVSRDYLASMLLAATAVPLVGIAGKAIQRAVHNRDVRKAIRMAKFPGERMLLESEIHRGPIIARWRPNLPEQKSPLTTTSELASDISKSVLMGTVVQMLRDRFSGEGKDKKDDGPDDDDR